MNRGILHGQLINKEPAPSPFSDSSSFFRVGPKPFPAPSLRGHLGLEEDVGRLGGDAATVVFLGHVHVAAFAPVAAPRVLDRGEHLRLARLVEDVGVCGDWRGGAQVGVHDQWWRSIESPF